MSTEIHQLVRDCLADDDPSAMMRLVSRFRGRVFGLCYRMLGQWQDAEDAMQETFLLYPDPNLLIFFSHLPSKCGKRRWPGMQEGTR